MAGHVIAKVLLASLLFLIANVNNASGRYPSSLASRVNDQEGEIFVGWNSSAAIVFPVSGHHLYLQVIQVRHRSKGQSPKVTLSAPLQFRQTFNVPRIHWTKNDDLILVQPGEITFSNPGTLKSCAIIRQRHASLMPFTPFSWLRGDAIPPSRVLESVLIPRSGKAQKTLEFNPSTGQFCSIDATIGFDYAFLWNGGNLLGRTRVHIWKTPTFDIFDWQSGHWRKYELPPLLSSSAAPLLIRRRGRSDVEIVIHEPGEGAEPDKILTWYSGLRMFRILAKGRMERIVVSPSGEDVYGFFQEDRRFQIIADQTRSPEVDFWLARFARMDGLTDFGIFDQGRAAIVKQVQDQKVKIAVIVQENLNRIRELYLPSEASCFQNFQNTK